MAVPCLTSLLPTTMKHLQTNQSDQRDGTGRHSIPSPLAPQHISAVTETRDRLFRALRRVPFPGDHDAVAELKEAASRFREAGQYFYAGWISDRAVLGAWGDPDEMGRLLSAALDDFRQAVLTSAPSSYECLLALSAWRGG